MEKLLAKLQENKKILIGCIAVLAMLLILMICIIIKVSTQAKKPAEGDMSSGAYSSSQSDKTSSDKENDDTDSSKTSGSSSSSSSKNNSSKQTSGSSSTPSQTKPSNSSSGSSQDSGKTSSPGGEQQKAPTASEIIKETVSIIQNLKTSTQTAQIDNPRTAIFEVSDTLKLGDAAQNLTEQYKNLLGYNAKALEIDPATTDNPYVFDYSYNISFVENKQGKNIFKLQYRFNKQLYNEGQVNSDEIVNKVENHLKGIAGKNYKRFDSQPYGTMDDAKVYIAIPISSPFDSSQSAFEKIKDIVAQTCEEEGCTEYDFFYYSQCKMGKDAKPGLMFFIVCK